MEADKEGGRGKKKRGKERKNLLNEVLILHNGMEGSNQDDLLPFPLQITQSALSFSNSFFYSGKIDGDRERTSRRMKRRAIGPTGRSCEIRERGRKRR